MTNSVNGSNGHLRLSGSNGWHRPASAHEKAEKAQCLESPEALSIDQLLALDASPVKPVASYPGDTKPAQAQALSVMQEFDEALRGVRAQLNAFTEGEMGKIIEVMSKAQNRVSEANGVATPTAPSNGKAPLAADPAPKVGGKGHARTGHLVLAKGTWDFVRQSLRLARRPTAEPEAPQVVVVTEASQASAVPKEPEPPSPIILEPQVYQGKVRLSIRSPGSAVYTMQFVRQVSAMPELRLLRMAATRKEGLEILVGLREPLPLEERLSQMPRVATAKSVPGHDAGSQEPLIEISLAEAS